MRLRPLVIASLLSFAIASVAKSDTVGQLPKDDVLGYVEQLIGWQRDATAIEPSSDSAREQIYQDALQQNALKTLRSGFKFAQQQAQMRQVDEATPAAGEQATPQQRLAQRITETERNIAQLQTQLNAKHLTATQRKTLEGRLTLARAKNDLFHSARSNIINASNGNSKDMSGKLASLAREIPELAAELPKTIRAKTEESAPSSSTLSAFSPIPLPTASTAPAAATAARPVESVLSLAEDLFNIARKQRELREFTLHTQQLETANHALLKSLRVAMDNVTEPQDSASVDDQLATFKQIAASILPLGEANLWAKASEASLNDWQTVLEQRFNSILRRFFLQLALLAVAIAIPLLIGEAARRACNRYIGDPKRKRQANTARRIIVTVVVIFILLFNFISDFSSFATFAGFLTAGLAVALQSVLLSLVAHFFFYGRYGARAGDRVNVAGVTGDIIQIGMTRFYMRELTSSDQGFKPTGKIVAFPNSILFQPAAFYKYVETI